MNSIELIASLGMISVFLMVLFSFFLFTSKSEKKLSNHIFSVFLLITALDLSGLFLSNFISDNPTFRVVKTSSSLLQLPLFFLYVLSICYSSFRLQAKHLAHAFLFLIFIPVLKFNSNSEQSLLYYSIIGEIQYFVYMFAVFYVLKRYKTIYLENYSTSGYKGYKWLFNISLFFCFAHIFVVLKMGALFLEIGQNYIQLLYILISISALSIICWFVLKALYNPQLFNGINTELVPVGKTIKRKEIESEKDPSTIKAIEDLKSYMAKEKPYLDFDLSLEKLASDLKMSEKDLSLLINHHMGKHFFDFINQYRIDEAKKILEDPQNEKLTILEILYKVGFNSKSSFYTAFKKITDQTPTAYRKSALSG